jgi:plastocyanin
MARSNVSSTSGLARTVMLVACVVVSLALMLSGCGATSTTTSNSTATTNSSGGANTVQVVMKNIAFVPDSVTVNVGDTVVWTNEDNVQHNVTADNGEFKSDNIGNGGTYSFTFDKAGTYPYHCTIHPGMTGVVIVQ